MVAAGGCKALKVAELKEELGARGLSTTGKKDELVARLEEALVAAPVEAAAPVAAPAPVVEGTRRTSPALRALIPAPRLPRARTARRAPLAAQAAHLRLPARTPL